MNMTFISNATVHQFLEVLKQEFNKQLKNGNASHLQFSDDFLEEVIISFNRIMHTFYGEDFQQKKYIRVSIGQKYYFLDELPNTSIAHLEHVLDATNYPYIDLAPLELVLC